MDVGRIPDRLETWTMALPTEKRTEARHDYDADIMWAYFNTSSFHGARMVNVSRSGGYFLTEEAALPGATLFIRVHKFPVEGAHAACPDAPRTAALGEVKWCREVGSGHAPYFGVGFRYHIPV
jgi:hypothetical protein